MDLKKSQHFNFSYDAIPIMFHSQTKEFMKYLKRDGVKFLEFWWDYVGKQLQFEQLSTFQNVNFEVVDLEPELKFVIIKLPPPSEEGEMYFLGLVSRPERRFAWVKLPSTRVIGLVKRSRGKFSLGTEIGDVTPRGYFVSRGEGPEPKQEVFKEKCLGLIKRR